MRDHAELLLVLARALSTSSGEARWPALCRAAVSGLDADDGSITLAVSGAPELLCATSPAAARFGEAQEVAGEGPVLDALTSGLAVLSPDRGATALRWPRLGSFYDSLETGAVCALPMLAEPTEVVGVLTVHHDLRGSLGRSLHAPGSPDRARTLSDLQFVANTIGAVVVADAVLPTDHEERWSDRDHVSQATGMVIAQVGLGAVDALALLKARAFVEGATLAEISRRVLARDLDLGPRDRPPAAEDPA